MDIVLLARTVTLCVQIFLSDYVKTVVLDPHDFKYPKGSIPCKLFDDSQLDCSQRWLRAIPTFPMNITSVDLSQNYIMNISEVSFRGQILLTNVNLRENYVFSIHDSPFKWLSQLRRLDLSYTFLESLAAVAFQGLYDLEYLFLDFNRLTSLPEGIFECLENLRLLQIYHNGLTEIPSRALAPLTSLQGLNLIENYFSAFSFGEEFKNLTNLVILYVNAVFDGKHQRHVVLDNKTFQNLAKAPIKELRINFYITNNASVTIDSDVFVPFTNIAALQVSSIWESAVTSISSDLQVLDIFIAPDDMKLSTSSLDFASKWKSSLKQIDLSFSLIDGIYGPAFKVFSSLLILKLNSATFSMSYISDDAFSGLYNLRELHLARNQINKLPVQTFKVFENGTLEFLDLSYNALTGFFPDDKLFTYVSSLTHLNLSGNPVQTIGNWINALTNLQELKLDSLTTAMFLDVNEWTVPLQSMRQLYINWPTFKPMLNGFTQFIMSRHIPEVETLSLSGTYINSLATVNHLHHLNYLDGSGSFATFKNFEKSWGEVISLPQLQTLILASNRIHSIDSMMLNTTTPNVVHLDLSKNFIQTFSSETLKYLQQLQRLYLGGNYLVSVASTNSGLLYLPEIQILDISWNSITEIPRSFLQGLNGTLNVLNAGANPFACTCAIEPFRKWIL